MGAEGKSINKLNGNKFCNVFLFFYVSKRSSSLPGIHTLKHETAVLHRIPILGAAPWGLAHSPGFPRKLLTLILS